VKGSRARILLLTTTGRVVIFLVGLLAIFGLAGLPLVDGAAERLPQRLSDQEFWKLSFELSEPNGTFRSDNLLSNEIGVPYVLPEVIRTARPGRVYMGVGPEQNFHYIAALKPKLVFIVDIRRGNLDLHLLYKALFEMSSDRAEFVSRLFSKRRPPNLGPRSTVDEIFAAYASVATSEILYKENLRAVQNELAMKHSFPLTPEDIQGIEYVYNAFYTYGPDIRYSSSQGFYGGFNQPSYADLMRSTDESGQPRSYLATEESFAFLRDLEKKNLIVPIVGNFGGPRAIRTIGAYLKDHGATVSAFYLSNVEQYLWRDGIWDEFCSNVATLPLDETSTFIRAVRGGRYGQGLGLNLDLGVMASEVKECTAR
jgi:hypothetical protein